MTALEITRLDIYVFRAEIENPVVTSFGSIPSRGMALLRIEDRHGAAGWGEIWGNFPTITTEYRAALAGWALPAHLIGARITEPGGFCDMLAEKLRVLEVQSAEEGPVAGIIAAANQALWDLRARVEDLPLRRALRAEAPDAVPAYASGLNPGDCVEVVERSRAEGYRAFKLKIGFGDETDRRNLEALRSGMADGERLFVDANQRWSLDQARARIGLLEEMNLGWWEEPMIADAPAADWRALAAETSLPLAGGENLLREPALRESLDWFAVVQPDAGKWGGVDGCLSVARAALAAGKTYCPHWLAGGVGLMHSANLLAAAGGDGLLEIDSNDNPLRSRLIADVPGIRDGSFHMNAAPGIGIVPSVDELSPWLVSHETYR